MFGLFIITLVSSLSGYAILPRVALVKQAKYNKSLPQLSIIIPARNEAHNLPKLLTSLQNQTINPLEIIVVDDHSEDQTAVIARELNAKVVQSGGHENGWFGKSAACWTGAQAAQGDWFLFLDADIILPDAKSLARIVKEYHRRKFQV